jgi:hypothetical protein
MILDAEKLRDVLLSDYHYHASQVDGVIEQLLGMDPTIQKALKSYLVNQEMPDKPVFFGANPVNLAAIYPQKPPAIFLLLEWIRCDRRSAYAALQDEYHCLPDPLPHERRV